VLRTRGYKNRDFRPISRFISERRKRYRYRHIYNGRRIKTRYRMVPYSMTLNDLNIQTTDRALVANGTITAIVTNNH